MCERLFFSQHAHQLSHAPLARDTKILPQAQHYLGGNFWYHFCLLVRSKTEVYVNEAAGYSVDSRSK